MAKKHGTARGQEGMLYMTLRFPCHAFLQMFDPAGKIPMKRKICYGVIVLSSAFVQRRFLLYPVLLFQKRNLKSDICLIGNK